MTTGTDIRMELAAMPVTVSYSDIQTKKNFNDVPSILDAATSITAFVGRTRCGPVDEPVHVQSFMKFKLFFGGLWSSSALGYAVQHFFLNGGSDAIIVRIHNGAIAASVELAGGLKLIAANPGEWGRYLRVRVNHDTRPLLAFEPADSLFNLAILDTQTGMVERFFNLSTDPSSARFVTRLLEQESRLVRVDAKSTVPAIRPDAHGIPGPESDPLISTSSSVAFGSDGDDGLAITDDQISHPSLKTAKQGIWALEKAELFNLLCIPPLTRSAMGDINAQTRSAAVEYCQLRRAIFIVDPLSSWDKPADLTATNGLESAAWGLKCTENAALYFPQLRLPDPLQKNRLAAFPPCGAVAGVIARTDVLRGVWRAPAGQEATLNGVVDLTISLSDEENARLNSLGVNCLRSFPVIGRVVWGTRTLCGTDSCVSEWKFLPIRRLALFVEESIARGTAWAVNNPNDEPLWQQLRLSVYAFMKSLLDRRAFQGANEQEAFFVNCDGDTTTQKDIKLGIANVVIGFAALKPAEFIIVEIRQKAGKIAV